MSMTITTVKIQNSITRFTCATLYCHSHLFPLSTPTPGNYSSVIYNFDVYGMYGIIWCVSFWNFTWFTCDSSKLYVPIVCCFLLLGTTFCLIIHLLKVFGISQFAITNKVQIHKWYIGFCVNIILLVWEKY